MAVVALARFGRWATSAALVGSWSQSTVRHVMVRVAEATRLTSVTDDRQRRAQTYARHRQQHGHRGLRSELLKTPLKLEEGHFLLPEGPGLGIELDSATVERYRVC